MRSYRRHGPLQRFMTTQLKLLRFATVGVIGETDFGRLILRHAVPLVSRRVLIAAQSSRVER
jgi:hypothetical protein